MWFVIPPNLGYSVMAKPSGLGQEYIHNMQGNSKNQYQGKE